MSYNPKLTNKKVMDVVKKLVDEINTSIDVNRADPEKLEQIRQEALAITIFAHKLGISVGVNVMGKHIARWYKSKAEMDNWTDVMYI